MMSVLIKGMKMPKNCGVCPVEHYECMLLGDTYVMQYFDGDERHPYCPLIEVPTPHGRLIDADALANDGWTLHKQVMIMGGFAIHELPLKNPTIPTVIEAEDGE